MTSYSLPVAAAQPVYADYTYAVDPVLAASQAIPTMPPDWQAQSIHRPEDYVSGDFFQVDPRGRSHASWLRQVESYLRDTGMAGLASAWAMTRREAEGDRRKVDAATRCSGVCPHT